MTNAKRPEHDNDGLDLQEEDRLPWLEAVEDYDREPSVSPGGLMGLVVGGIAILGLIVGGIYWLQNRSSGQGDLIAAQEGDYKIAPATSGAKTFDGTGDASFATSEGAEPSGKIDASKVAEAPAVSKIDAAAPAGLGTGAAKSAAKTVPAPGAPKMMPPATAPAKMAAKVAPGASAVAAAPAAAAASGTAMIQLGAFGSEASANTAWGGLTKRFSYLNGLGKTVVPAAVGGGTVYRLRVNAGSSAQAADFCKKLKAAGENCIVVR